MAQTESESSFICFQSLCFLIYVGLPDRERTPESQRLGEENAASDWPCLLAQGFKGAGWNWKEVGSKHLSHLSLASLSRASWGRLHGHGSCICIPGLARCPQLEALTPSQHTRMPFSAKAGWWFFLEWQISPSPQAWDDLLAGTCVAELQVVRTRFGRDPSLASSQEPPFTHQIRTGCLQNPGSPSCSTNPASRVARASFCLLRLEIFLQYHRILWFCVFSP